MKEGCKRIGWLALIFVLGSFFPLIAVDLAAKEKVVVVGSYSPVQSLDPGSSPMAQLALITRNIFQGLMRYKSNSADLEGDLAKSWSRSKDGLVYTFKLRENISFHKGFGKVTAQDVKFSFEYIMDPKNRSVFLGEVSGTVKEVKAVDDLTVEIHLKDRDSAFLHKCVRPKPVAIMSQKAIAKYGKDFARNPIGSGPFIFESMTREQIVLVANKDYHEGPPKIDKVIYKVIPDADTQVLAIQKGELDLIFVFPREKAVLDRVKAAGCKVKSVDYGAWHELLLNSNFKPFTDVRVRRALAHAIDRDTIIEHVFSGMADKLNSPIPKGYFGHTEQGLRKYEYDPKKSKELLAEAGYPNGIEFTFDTFNSPSYLPLATALQAQWEKVGIKVKLDVTDQPAWMKKIMAGTSTLTLFQPSRIHDADGPLMHFFHSASFAPGTNLFRYNKLDKQIDEARKELDNKKRLKAYAEIQKKLMEEIPVIPLFMMYFPTPHRSHIAGLPDKDPIWGFDFYFMQYAGEK